MFEQGDRDAELNACEDRLGITIPPRVRELMTVCTGAGFPAPRASIFPAEMCLVSCRSWYRPIETDGSLAEAFGWSVDTLRDHVVIGFNPEGADYSNPVLLRLSSGEVFGVTHNIPEITCLGPFDRWVSEQRPQGCDNPRRMYAEARDEDNPSEVVSSHSFYLRFAPEGLNNEPRSARWRTVESELLEALQQCSVSK